MRTLGVGLLAVLAGGLACGGGSTEPSGTSAGARPPPPPGQSVVSVSIQDFSFTPGRITVKPGAEVVWTNVGRFNHTTTSDLGLWNSGLITGDGGGGVYSGGNAGGSYRYTFGPEGSYEYHCSIHPTTMRGTVIVAE